MKVILLQHVPRVGGAGEMVEVSPGYARNYLLPRALAGMATPAVSARLAGKLQHERNIAVKAQQYAKKAVDRLAGKIFTVKAKASRAGTLYAAVTNQQIALLLQGYGYAVDKKYIRAEPVKGLGEHAIEVCFGQGLIATIILIVVPEDEGSD